MLNNTLISILGFAAATLTTVAFVPQVLYCWRTKDTCSISFGMYSCFCLGVLLWLVYGLLIQQWPIVCANVLTLMLASSILWLKIKEQFNAASGSRFDTSTTHMEE